MPIRAQLPDGQVLEFPDGTADSVIDSTVKSFLKPAAATPAPAAPSPTEGLSVTQPLGGEFAAFAPALGTPPARSVTEQVVTQRQAPGLPVDPLLEPRFVKAVEGQLNALPAEQRAAALEKLLQREDVYGRAARVVQRKYAQLDKIETQVGRDIADPRLEAQVDRYIRQGASRDLAEHLARKDALSGRMGRLQRLERDVVGEKASAEAEARAQELAGAGFLERVGAEAASGMTKAGLGLINAFADVTGDKEAQRIAANARRVEQARQGAIPKGATIFERSAQGAIASLATQAPMVVLSIATGTSAPVLLQAGLQQFGDSYGEARAAGVSPDRAAARAVPMAAAEIFFERFGMERAMAGLKAFVDKNGYAEVPKYVAKAIATELPSEMATTVTQYGIDILPEIGLNKNPSLLGLYQQLEETLRQTVIQAGAQSGLVITGAKGAQRFGQVLERARPQQYVRDESYDGLAELLARSKGFLTPEGRQAPPAEAAPPAKTAPVAPAAPAAVSPDARIEELTARGVEAGLPEEDARVRAQNIVATEQAQQEQALAPRIEALTQEFIDAGVEPAQARAQAVEQAKQEAEADALAEREITAGGAAAPVPGPSGEGMAVAGGPQPGAPTGGVAGVEPAGVAPAGPAAQGVAGGEAGAPAALEPAEVEAAALETTPPKKRGRPATLTPEEKAAKASEKKPLQAAKMKAERAVARITKSLDALAQPIDLEKIESDEALAEAEADRTAKRREAVKELLQLQSEPNLRGTKVGERIKAALGHPSITPKELADIKAGIEAQKRALSAAETVSRAGTETAARPVESAFTKFTNAAQAINHIIKNGTPFEKMLAKRLRGFVNGVKLVVVEEGQPLPNRLTMPRNRAAWERARALYAENDISGDRAIFLRGASFGDDHGMTTTIVLHELLHAATNRKIALAIKAIQEGKDLNSPLVRSAQDLLRTMNSAISRYNEMADAGQLSAELAAIARSGEALTDPREFISYGMTDPAFQQFLMTAYGREEDVSFFTRFVDGIRKLFGMGEDTVNALSDLIVITDKILSARAPRGRVGEAVSRASKVAEEIPLESIELARPAPALKPLDTSGDGPTPSLKRRLAALRRRRDQMTDEAYAEAVDEATDAVALAEANKPVPDRVRGADYIRERILNAKREGAISAEAADLAEWFILQNPAIVADLGISFRQAKEEGVGGQYLPLPRIARILKERGSDVTVIHEILHHFERMMPQPVREAISNEWYRQFLKAQKKAKTVGESDFFRLLEQYHESGDQALFKAATDMLKKGFVPIEHYQYVNPSEFWAVNASRIMQGNFTAVRGNILTKLKNWLGKSIERIKGLFRMRSDAPVLRALRSLQDSDGRFFSDRMLMEDADYFSVEPTPSEADPAIKAAERTQKEIERDFDIANEKFNQSLNGEEYAKSLSSIQMLQDPKKVGRWVRSMWRTFSVKARDTMTYVAPTDFLATTFGEDVPELLNTDKLIQKMGGLTLNLLKSAGKLTDEVNRAYRKDKTLQAKLDRITNVSTLMEVDPSNPNAKERSAKLDQMWADLGADGQRLYTRIKEHFEVLSDYFTQLLDEQITQSDLPIAERANLMQKIRALYETGTKITPFFPLVRRGDYWLSIGSGKTRKFFMFETMAERDEAMQGFADERVKRKPNESAAAFEARRAQNLQDLLESQEYTFGNDIGSLRRISEDTSELLKGVFAAIENTTLSDPEAKEALKDAVYQIYLQTMPEQSFRRQFIHRKGVTGFRTDILRNTADASTRMASQLARLKYGRLLRNSLSQARDSIVNRPEYEPIVDAFERRVREELNPQPETKAEKVVGAINKASFIWYLGAASSALLQPLSIFQTGLPVLAAQHGFGKASAELSKMMKVWNQYGVYERNADGSLSFKMPTVEHAEGLTQEERRAVRAMLDFGLTTSTYADNIFDYKNTPSGSYSHPIVQFGKDTVDNLVLGGLMHTTERISREVVFLTAFRLNRRAGKSYEEAIDQAVLDTKEALGNYGEYNRPEIMRGATGKFLTQFMMYPVHVTLFLVRNFIEMIRPMGGRTRSEAVRKFFGTLGTTLVLAGAVGLPMFSTVMGFLGWAWSKLVPDDDEELRKLSFELWFRTKWLQEQLGETKIAGKSLADIVERGLANAITGLDISGRTSLNNLWMRDTKEYATVRENAMAMAMEKAGPSANMVLSWAEAYEAAMLGDYAKAVKKATPAGFRNFITAHEQYKEGAKDNKGAKILSRDAFTTGELLGQAIGFRSDLLANTQYVTFKVIGLEQKINNERNTILNQLDREFRQRDMKGFAKYMRERNEFNQKYPSYAITDEALADSLETKTEKRVSSYRGVTLTEKNIGLARALIPSRKAAAEKEKEGREE